MSESVHLCLTDLIDSDVSSNEFFYSLSPELQKSLINKDIRTFDALQNCAEQFNQKFKDNRDEILDNYTSSFSTNECTGLIPSGSNQSQNDFENYQDMYPFSNPPL